MNYRITVFVTLLLMLGGVAQSDDKQKHVIDLSTEACLEKNQSTAGMLECFNHAEHAWDTELNRVYKALQSRLKPDQQETLKQAQRAWLSYRDQEYSLLNVLHAQLEGTMWIPVMADKRASLLRERALMLEGYLTLLTQGEP